MPISAGSRLGHYEVLAPLSFAPADAAGVLSVGPVLLSADGKYYVYSYRRLLDDLYVVTGAH